MKEYVEILKKCSLFENFEESEIILTLTCLKAEILTFKKDNNIFDCLDSIRIGILLSGRLQNIQMDYQGNQNIIATFFPSDIFGETFVCANENNANVSIIADCDCEIMFIDYKKVMSLCQNVCSHHRMFIENMLKTIAMKNILLTRKLQVITKRTTREKIMHYLKQQQHISKDIYFEIPFSRQELADYLSVERTAMCAELGKLRDDGVISFQKNKFKIHV